MRYIDVTGKTEAEAIEKALAQLGLSRDDVSVEILERAKSGFLGLGSSPAKVRVSYDDPAEEAAPVVEPAPAPAQAPQGGEEGGICGEDRHPRGAGRGSGRRQEPADPPVPQRAHCPHGRPGRGEGVSRREGPV